MKRTHPSHPPADTVFSPGLHRLGWLNITVQTAFPMSVAFTPVTAGAGEQHFLRQPASLSAKRTQVYTLGAGETAASVAKKSHLTLDQLREINQLRIFAHGPRMTQKVAGYVICCRGKSTSLLHKRQ